MGFCTDSSNRPTRRNFSIAKKRKHLRTPKTTPSDLTPGQRRDLEAHNRVLLEKFNGQMPRGESKSEPSTLMPAKIIEVRVDKTASSLSAARYRTSCYYAWER